MEILTLDQMLAQEFDHKHDASASTAVKTTKPLPHDESTYLTFDLHCDTADRLAWATLSSELKQATGLSAYGPEDDKHPDEVRELAHNRCHISLDRIGSTPWIQCFATFVPDELSPAQALAFYRQVDSYLDTQLEKNAARIAAAEPVTPLSQQLEAGKTIAVRTVENARMLALDASYAHDLAERGVRMASLSWNAAGPLASGHDTLEGLTRAGRAALTELERAGIIVDVSHLNDVCFAEVCRATAAPLVASHSNSRAVCPAPRNLTDAQFCEIRDRKGLVGINFCCDFLAPSHAGLDDIARHIEHFLDLGGEDILALGSDYDGCDVPACVADASCMPQFQRDLAHFFGEVITRKICGTNALRFFDAHPLRA